MFYSFVIILRRSLLIIPLLTLVGCDSTFRGEPLANRSGHRNSFTEKILSGVMSDANISRAVSTSGTGDDGQLILARMAEIDLLYNTYETQLLTESQKSGLGFNLAGILTSAAATVTTGAAAQNYALMSTLSQSGRTAFQKEVLAERTINALISQMRANRAQIRANIYAKIGKRNYTVVAALGDLELYRQAGTLASALVEIGETAAEAQREGEEAAVSAVNSFHGVTGVQRTTRGPDVGSQVVTENFQTRVANLQTAMTNGTIPNQKIAALLNDLPMTDDAYKQQFIIIADVVKATSGQSTVRAEDLTDDLVAAVAGIVATTTDPAHFTEVENFLTQ